MKIAPLPDNETERLEALRSYGILDTEPEVGLDRLVGLAAEMADTPIALISLIDAERQWFKARRGLDAPEIRRDLAFCAHAILDPDNAFVVEDAAQDERFADNPLVTGAPNIGAYLGVPLVNPEGHALGALCVIDCKPRPGLKALAERLAVLARAVNDSLELRRTLLRLKRQALTDPLTGLLNRRALMEALNDISARQAAAAVMAIDLDYFKSINDTLGHEVGDVALRAVSDRIRQTVRSADLIARTGGDEFAVVLLDDIERETASAVAQRLCETLNLPLAHSGRQLRLGATLGVALLPADADDAALALRAADEALMAAKKEGRGRVVWASRRDVAKIRRAPEVFRAFDLDRGACGSIAGAQAFLQPIVAFKEAWDSEPPVIAFEALPRWEHPSVGEIEPAELTEVIGPERSALFCSAVRVKAMAALAELRRRDLTAGRLAVNLTVPDALGDDLAESLAAETRAAGLTLQDLELEIAEDAVADRVSDEALRPLALLRAGGARLVLDDFGHGHAGLSPLTRLPFDGVKLDRSFVRRLGHDQRAEALLRAILSMARSLNLRVVANGVDTAVQLQMARTLGCAAAQGAMISPPLPLHRLEAWLVDHGTHTPVEAEAG